MATPPTKASDAESTYTAANKTVTVGSIAAGDVLIAFGGLENGSIGNLNVATGGAGTWTNLNSFDNGSPLDAACRLDALVSTGAAGSTLSMSRTAGAMCLSGSRWTGSDGFGNSGGGGPVAAVDFNATTAYDNSALLVGINDWDADDGSAATMTIGGSSATRIAYVSDASFGTFYVYFLNDCGTAGTKAVDHSMTAMNAVYSWVEIRGAAAAAALRRYTLPTLGVG